MPSATYLEVYVIIDATEYTAYTQESLGLDAGVFKWQLGDSSAQTGFTAGILTEIGDISRSVDISETGGLFTDGAFDCSIKNTDNFQSVLESYGIKFIGLPVIVDVYKFTNVPTTSRLFTGFISAWSVSETEINISANVDSIIPDRDLQETIVDLKTWPYAPEASVGLPYPVICGDVEYSPTINVNNLRSVKCGAFPLDITSDDYATNGTYRLHIYDDYITGFNCNIGDLVSFCMGTDLPSKKYYIVEKGYNYIVIKGLLEGYTGHLWYPPWDSTQFKTAWWYNIENNQGDIIASNLDIISESKSISESLSAYSSNEYVPLYGMAKAQDNGVISIVTENNAISAGDLRTLTTKPIVSSMSNGFSIEVVGSDPVVLDPPLDPEYYYTLYGTLATVIDREYSQGVRFDRISEYKNTTVKFFNIVASDLPDTDSDVILAIDFSAPLYQDHFMKEITIVTWTKSVSNIIYDSRTIATDTVQIIGQQLVPKSYYIAEGISGKVSDRSDLLIDNTAYNSCFTLPENVYNGLKSGAFQKIEISITIRTTIAAYPDPTINIISACWLYDITTQENPNYYISTEGETLGNDGATHCNTISKAIGHLAIDYAGIASITTSGASMSNHVGRTLNEQITVADAISSICKQGFVAGYIGKHGTPVFESWLDSSGSTPAYAFTSRNIIRDSIGGWNTTPLANCYNSFDIKHNIDYETGAYRYTMGIKAPQTAFPAITGAWDGLVYGIGTGSDSVAYAEASEAHSFVEAGYDETGIIKAMPPEMGELSWYVDPSWVGTPVVKTNLSAWKYLKNCAWWLSAPRKEVTFRVPLTFLGVELLDYCSFTDAIFTSGEVYYGWVTSLRITTEDIELTMSMGRKSLSDTYTETGSADTTIDESGSRADTITEGA